MLQNKITLSQLDYKEIFFDSINSENGSMCDYLFSKYILYKDLNPRFLFYIKMQLDESIKIIKTELEKKITKKKKISEINFVMSHNAITLDVKGALKSSSSNNNYITTLNKITDSYSQLVELIGEQHSLNSKKIKLKWGGNKIQINYLLHKLKKAALITNTYESLALFLIENVDQYDGDNKQTVMDDLKNGKFPKRGINLDGILTEVKESK